MEAVDAAFQLSGGRATLKLKLARIHHRTQEGQGLCADVLASVTQTSNQIRQEPAKETF